MLKPLMQFVLENELTTHPKKDPQLEQQNAILAQELLEDLWQTSSSKPNTFWGKVKFAMDGRVDVDLPLKMFNKITRFRKNHNLSREDMQNVMSYLGRAFNEGNDMLYAACWLFHHKPTEFRKYATNPDDFNHDVREGNFKEDNVFMPAIGLGSMGIAMMAGQTGAEEERAEYRRLPLRSFGPIKCGYHPSLSNSFREIQSYRQMLQEPAWRSLQENQYRNIYFNKLLHFEYPESSYPVHRHQSLIVAANEFNKRLKNEKAPACPLPEHKQAGLDR